jgi:hypothetical protein
MKPTSEMWYWGLRVEEDEHWKTGNWTDEISVPCTWCYMIRSLVEYRQQQNRFAALESLGEGFDINKACESIRENSKTSAK